MVRLTLATVLALGLAASAKAGEFDNDANPVKAKAAKPTLANTTGGSELDKESPTQAHRFRGWGGRWGGWGGGWGGWGWGGGWGRGLNVNIGIGRGWGGWGWGGGWNRGWGWGGGWGRSWYPSWGWGGGWGGWGWSGYSYPSYRWSYPAFTAYPLYTSYTSYYTPVYYTSAGFAPCYY